jgi:hypothetical protein
MPPDPPTENTDEFEAANVPSPFPRKMTTELKSVDVSAKSNLPSPFTSAATIAVGPESTDDSAIG